MGHNRHSTERKAEIYEVIKSFLMEKGYPPSVREIGSIVGLKSSSTVHGYLSQLEDDGKIRRDPTKPRAIDLVDDQAWKRTSKIPLVKKVTATENVVTDVYALPSEWIPDDDESIMLKVTDNHLASYGIMKNDHVIVKLQDTAKNKDILLVIVGKKVNAVLRRYVKESGALINDAGAEDSFKTATIIGKVIAVYHQF